MKQAEKLRREIIRLHCQAAESSTESLKGDLVRDAKIHAQQVDLIESYARETAIEFCFEYTGSNEYPNEKLDPQIKELIGKNFDKWFREFPNKAQQEIKYCSECGKPMEQKEIIIKGDIDTCDECPCPE